MTKSWQVGTYNPDYIIYNYSLVGQNKFISNGNTILSEICIEKFIDGQMSLIFTVNDNVMGHFPNKKLAKMALNNLFNELNSISKRTSLEFRTNNEDIHIISANLGQERMLSQVLNELELLEPSLLEIRTDLNKMLSLSFLVNDPVKSAIKNQESRLDLLRKASVSMVDTAKKVKAKKADKKRKSS